MTVRVGVIGTGMIGTQHIQRITEVIPGGRVIAVTDADVSRAERVAAGFPGVRLHPAGQDLIADSAVDAVLVTSWGATHEEYVLAAIAAGKRVFCEKPLAPTADGAMRVVEAEMAAGQRLVQVGFMRRYDPGYNALKDALEEGQAGTPLLMHCAHRNPSAPPYGFTTDMIISDSAVHEIDLVRWLFGEEIAATSVLRPRPTSQAPEGLQDPLVLLLEMASGILADVEVFVNARYGYDIRAEVVGEAGTLELATTGEAVVTRRGRRSARVAADWRERFGRAFDAELTDWLRAVATGTTTGPGAWDGYAAALVTDQALQALRTGGRVPVTMPECPDFYAKAQA